MKQKLLLTFIAATLLSLHGKAQLLSGSDSTAPKGQFGVKGGLHMQQITGMLWEKSYAMGWHGGLWARIHKNNFGVRAEILASSARYTCASFDSAGKTYPFIADSVGNKGDFGAIYLDIPVMLEYTFIDRISIQAGVQYSNLMALNNRTPLKPDYKTLFHPGEFAVVAGVEVKLPFNFSIGGRYKHGLSNVNNEVISNSVDTWKTTGIQAFVCYKIK
ncbi:MAG: PorT family protein [Flavipsychrobacter sp.]|nr:PorT family protein [Flavipsychrobacter sp.]